MSNFTESEKETTFAETTSKSQKDRMKSNPATKKNKSGNKAESRAKYYSNHFDPRKQTGINANYG